MNGTTGTRASDRLVQRYLRELSRALGNVPAARREELLEEVAGHIDESLANTSQPSESDVRNTLERLGDPAEIAKEARTRFGLPDSEPSWKEWAAVFLLLLGGIVLPLLGWVIGVVLLWSSQVWNTRDKLIGTLLVPFGLGLPLFAITFAASGCGRAYRNGQLVLDTCAHRSAIQTVLPDVVMALLVLIPIGTAIYLGRRLIHR